MDEAALPVDGLTDAVRDALGLPDAELLDWAAEPLAYQDFGGGTRSLHRVRGAARAPGSAATLPWSVVAKVFRAPASPDDRTSDDPVDYAYWRREPLLYSSGLLDEAAGHLRPPRCHGVTTTPHQEIVWLEAVADIHPDGWDVGRFELAARHLGEFNGRWLAEDRVPMRPWLASLASVLEYWTIRSETARGLATLLDPEAWADATRNAGFPNSNPEALRQLLRDRQPAIDALLSLPQTFAHNDAMAANLFATGTAADDETVAIDWQLAGPAPVGAELAMLVAGSVVFLRTPVGSLRELETRCLAGYLDGLAAAGAIVDPEVVRFVYAAASVLRMGVIVASWTLNLAEDEDRAWSEEFWGRRATELAAHWAPLVPFLDDQARFALSHGRETGSVTHDVP